MKLFKTLNPQFHEFLTSGAANSSKQSLKIHESKSKSGLSKLKKSRSMTQIEEEDDENASGSEQLMEECLYYNCYHEFKKTYTENELALEPRPRVIWAHISCVQFLCELAFEDKSGPIDGIYSLSLSKALTIDFLRLKSASS